MPGNKTVSDGHIFQFKNCRILRNHSIFVEDLWVRDGKIIDPEKLFYVEKGYADFQVDCKNAIIAPGFIDVQINGGFGIDFSSNFDDIEGGVQKVAKGILQHGCTSFCPTIISSSKEVYKKVLPKIKIKAGGRDGAEILGVHVEGPFISKEKRGAHLLENMATYDNGFSDVLDMYHDISSVRIVTLAPELPRSLDVIREFVDRGVVVSLGHSMASLSQGEEAVKHGASFITHLFNAMLPFHHRDPHLVGLLASYKHPPDLRIIYYGIISDGIHTNPCAERIAHRTHAKGSVLVTDAVAAMGLPSGTHRTGTQMIEIQDKRALIAGTDTLCGSIATMNQCVKYFYEATECTMVDALESASLHPARLLKITDRKGSLDYGTDADFVMLDDSLNLLATYIGGELVWDSKLGYDRVVNHGTRRI
ncbi:N-acetylglucosamine-6-phosphate deacetylase-like isoform X2 [Lingula anatina]|uniref:N-acetylglucosamine-6-phosphate deacetylase n=1 Tax=Lingula anatina TaxID=7574 RepID=A0A1S3HS76_LINAN|nr:N-acetylglucosamine-6-phosphate deacetylase-like isoform X2 [Lingula anatina]|eukprot:XP_013388887.1 N-acetylglucosamine-6-phosphate deacetylase-like isoform X2 [Lingula anatina]